MVQKNIKLRKDDLVNGEEDNRRGRKLYHGDQIQVLNQTFLID